MVLEKAVLNHGKEEDVHTELTVTNWGFSIPGQKDNVWVELSLVLPDGSGARELELVDRDNPEEKNNQSLLPGNFRNGKSTWAAFFVLQRPEDNRLNFRIRYASGLKEAEVPVSFRIGMAGIVLPAGAAGENCEINGNGE